MSHKSHRPLVIGWRETIALPDWHIYGLLAKSDTGARGSAIDASKITELPEGRIRFEVVLDRTDRSLTKTVEAEVIGRSRVRSSNGKVQERYKVRTTLRIGDIEKEVDFTLVNRKRMLCRVLLGRAALENDFLVDSKSTYLFGPRKRKNSFHRQGRRDRDTNRLQGSIEEEE